MAVKAAIALADLSAVEPINASTGGTRSRSWDPHRRETAQRKGKETGQQSRGGMGRPGKPGDSAQSREHPNLRLLVLPRCVT